MGDVPAESVIYEKEGVKITNLRAVIDSKTYAMSNITSVSMKTESENAGCAIALFIIGGLVAVVYGFSEQAWLWVGAGAAFVVLAIYLSKNEKKQYIVQIGSSSGETNALKSQDEGHIRGIVDAMNEAIVRRG